MDSANARQMSDTSLSMPTDDAAPELNPLVNPAELAETFKRTGRVQIPHVFKDASARRLHYALEHETPWSLYVNDDQKRREFETISPFFHQEMALAAWDRARSGKFQFFYHCHRLSANGKAYPDPDHYLFKLVALLSAPHFLDFIREVTGTDAIEWTSSDATLYKPLDFLTMHTDGSHAKDRLVAYALNMTPNWCPDWGGALQFYDRSGRIEESYLPAFNTLNLFRVPKFHSVTQVAVFGGQRYSVSGWFHGKPNSNPAELRKK